MPANELSFFSLLEVHKLRTFHESFPVNGTSFALEEPALSFQASGRKERDDVETTEFAAAA